jgi:exodeoxyribonuclease III
LDWLAKGRPDVVCLQELKSTQDAFPEAALRSAGYGAVWQGQPTWNGVAILARGAAPVLTRSALPDDASDRQSRYIEAAVAGVLIGCIYLPNGNPQPGPKFTYKLAWFDRLSAHAAELAATGLPAILAGDYNVVPTDDDIYPTRSWAKDALLQPAARMAFQRLLDQGWVDALRARHPAQKIYTFWDYKRDRWRAEPVCALTTFCSAQCSPAVWSTPASTRKFAVRRARATMRQPGSFSRANGWGPNVNRSVPVSISQPQPLQHVRMSVRCRRDEACVPVLVDITGSSRGSPGCA